MKAANSLVYVLVFTAFLICPAGLALGVVLHPGSEPNLVTWTDRPPDDVVGRWYYVASCVAVSSNCVITTRHQGLHANLFVEIAGKQYPVSQVWDHNTADLRVAKLYGANLANFVDIYTNIGEVGKNIVISGYGDGRGELLQQQGITYGYQWDNTNNTTLRFGTNRVDRISNNSNLDGIISNVIIADFDGLGDDISTTYEGITAAHDSGSGWFIKVAGIWEVAGLSRTVQVHYEAGHEDDPNYIIYEQSWFRDSNDPNILSPDYFDAVRLKSYADWIYQTIPPRMPGELTGDEWVDFADLAVFVSFWLDTDCHSPDWCLGADFEPDGDVDFADFAQFACYWLQD